MPHSEIAIDLSVWAGRSLLRPLQALIGAPSLLFFATLTAILLRPPDVPFYEIDRVVFGLLVVGVVGREVVLGQKLFIFDRVTWPMIGLLSLALASMIGQPFNHETWSLLASKLIIPLGLFYLAGLVFADERRFRQFEVFALVMLAYLSFTSIAFLCGAHSLIFPKFILDESLGFHASRARGPFLQAVANGLSLNLLGLLALHTYRRGSVRGAKMIVLLGAVPFAILATMTRTVWLSFAGSAGAILFLSKHRRFKSRDLLHALLGLALIAGAGAAVVLSSQGLSDTLSDRLEERGPVDYRAAVFAGGWEMFLEHPLIGWGFHQMPAELPRYVSEYNRRYIQEKYPRVAVEKLLVARLGVEVTEPAALTDSRPKTGDALTLLAVGRLHAVKDHAFLVRACYHLLSRNVNFECAIAGDGLERRNLKALIRELGLEARITLLGHVAREDMASYYDEADVVVLTSRSEGVPLVLMEAMARGRIVLAPAITGIPELVVAGKTGFLYESGSLDDFVSRLLFIRTLLLAPATPELRPYVLSAARQLSAIRQAAREQVFLNFNRSKNLESFGDAFLRRVAPHTESIPHEDFVLQQI